MQFNKIEPSPLLELSLTSNVLQVDILPSNAAITFLSPGDDDDLKDEDGDWSDIDDEDFEDMAEDRDDLHEMELDNDIFDAEDGDHLPDDDD
jgi:hypothetical protein